MLKITVKQGESIKIGDNVIVKSMTEGRAELAIDAPREIKIEKFESKPIDGKNSIRMKSLK